jgi:hypothetical protein
VELVWEDKTQPLSCGTTELFSQPTEDMIQLPDLANLAMKLGISPRSGSEDIKILCGTCKALKEESLTSSGPFNNR